MLQLLRQHLYPKRQRVLLLLGSRNIVCLQSVQVFYKSLLGGLFIWLWIVANRLRDLKRELISQQVKFEITELNSTTALQRFGAPFRSDLGEVSPLDSDLPILRYIFVHHVREFPFLDKAKEKEFWQDKLQIVCRPRPILQRNEPLTWENSF